MDYKKYNDYELVYMVRENDEYSNKLLFEKYVPIILSITNRYYKQYNGLGYDYEDFYQEALAAFYKAISNYDESKETLFYSFVVLCINRSLMSFCRKLAHERKNYFNVINIDIDDLDYEIKDVKNDINNILSFNEIEKVIKEVLFTISIEISSILELKLNGFTYKEISKLLDIPVSSVEFRCRKGKVLLRKRMSEYYCK